MRCSELIPLNPAHQALIEREEQILAAWQITVDELVADGWQVVRKNTTESPLTGTYRLFYMFRPASAAT